MNSNYVLIGNGRLPLEILVQLFEHYLDEESPFHPVEALLLVCKDWNRAAAYHSPIWGTYRITLGDERTTRLWLHRIPLRLRRSGSKQPLHIDIRYADNEISRQKFMSPLDSFQLDAQENIPRLLNILAGRNGVHCARWGSLRLTVESLPTIFVGKSSMNPMKSDLKPLMYQMPALTSLHLRLSTGLAVTLFPTLPSVHSIILDHCYMFNYPDISSVKELHVLGGSFVNVSKRNSSFDSPKVEYLRLGSWMTALTQPCKYPSLSTLCIDGHWWITGIEKAYMPRLKGLHIRFGSLEVLFGALSLPNLDQIQDLHLVGYFFGKFPPTDVQSAVSRLLSACTDLRTFCINHEVLSLLLLGWTTWQNLFEEYSSVQVFLISSPDLMVAERRGPDERLLLVGDYEAISSLKRFYGPAPCDSFMLI
ncbi:hypothetical protein FRC19_006525 [Serendipita sp. 401]|nr:hypothetical protein FRC19_006525 [Serendipita sp. 401]KAG9058096.1 hypothetical protein FS842_001677 [Serendipita sp. 407]